MKKWLILLFTAIATTTAAAQSDEEITAPVEPLQSNESEGEEIQELAPEAPVVINERIDEEPEFDIPAPPDKAPETIEDLQLQLEKNTKTYKMYKAFQYTSVTVAGIGLLLVILDAFIDTGSEYPFTPIPSDNNPDPSPVTTAFGNLSIAGLSERALQSVFSFRTENTATNSIFSKKKSEIYRNWKRRKPDWKIWLKK